MASAKLNAAARPTEAARCRGGTPGVPRCSEKPKLGSSVTAPVEKVKSRTMTRFGCAGAPSCGTQPASVATTNRAAAAAVINKRIGASDTVDDVAKYPENRDNRNTSRS